MYNVLVYLCNKEERWWDIRVELLWGWVFFIILEFEENKLVCLIIFGYCIVLLFYCV